MTTILENIKYDNPTIEQLTNELNRLGVHNYTDPGSGELEYTGKRNSILYHFGYNESSLAAKRLSDSTGINFVDDSWGNDTTAAVVDKLGIRVMLPNTYEKEYIEWSFVDEELYLKYAFSGLETEKTREITEEISKHLGYEYTLEQITEIILNIHANQKK